MKTIHEILADINREDSESKTGLSFIGEAIKATIEKLIEIEGRLDGKPIEPQPADTVEHHAV